MSWNTYINSIIDNSKDPQNKEFHIDQSCIIGLDGGAKWTSDDEANNLKLTAEEAAKIAKVCKENDISSFEMNGIYVGGIKYQFLRYNEGVILGKKKSYGALTIHPSKMAIVIAHCPEGKQHGICNSAVSKIVEYLISMNM